MGLEGELAGGIGLLTQAAIAKATINTVEGMQPKKKKRRRKVKA
jgi:hypothetical protein